MLGFSIVCSVRPVINYIYLTRHQCVYILQSYLGGIKGYVTLTRLLLKIEILTIFFLSFSLTWESMGVNNSKRYFSCTSQSNVFKLVLNFHLHGPHKIMWGIFEIMSYL